MQTWGSFLVAAIVAATVSAFQVGLRGDTEIATHNDFEREDSFGHSLKASTGPPDRRRRSR